MHKNKTLTRTQNKHTTVSTSGVTSRGAKPVPPVVRIKLSSFSSHQSTSVSFNTQTSTILTKLTGCEKLLDDNAVYMCTGPLISNQKNVSSLLKSAGATSYSISCFSLPSPHVPSDE